MALIANNKGFRWKWKQIRNVEKVYSIKTKSTVRFSSGVSEVFWKLDNVSVSK